VNSCLKLHRWIGVSLILGIVLALGGCSSARPPVDELSAAELAVREAESGKAAQFAPLELRLARDKFSNAKEAMDNKDYVRARHLAEQALVDAQLAEAKALSESSRQSAQEMQQTIEALRREAEPRLIAPSTP
jgi:hypothetical protein